MCTDFRKPLRRVAIKFGDLFCGMVYGKKGNMVARQGTKLRRSWFFGPRQIGPLWTTQRALNWNGLKVCGVPWGRWKCY